MASYLAFYDHADEQSLLDLWILREKWGGDLSVADMAALDEAGITSLIGTLVADTYSKIYICNSVAEAHAAGHMTYDQVVSLDAYLATAAKGTPVALASGVCQANATTTNIILISTASASNDTYNGYGVTTTGVTAISRYIKDYTGASKVALVVSTGTAITTTETASVFPLTNIHMAAQADSVTGKKSCWQTWTLAFGTAPVPLLVHLMGDYLFHEDHGTAQSIADTTHITLTASAGVGGRIPNASRANDCYNNQYVYISSSTLGTGQVRKVSDYNNSTKSATIDAAWNPSPTGTILYGIVSNLNDALKDEYAKLFVKTYFFDITNVTAQNDMSAMLNSNDGLVSGQVYTPQQSMETLTAYLVKGKAIFDYIALD